MSVGFRLLGIGLLAGLAGCDSAQSTAELHSYLQATRARPGNTIPLAPTVTAPRLFTYDAMTLRSPFQVVPGGRAGSWQASLAGDGQDANRSRQYLESLDLEQMEMVGTLSNELGANALLRANGVIHRLKVGDYLGRNNGQVASIGEAHVEVFEVISDGRGGWLERSLTIPLKQQS